MQVSRLHCLRAGHPALDVVASVLSPGQPANGPSVYGPGPVRQEAVQPVQAAQLGVGVAQAVRPGRAGAVLKEKGDLCSRTNFNGFFSPPA